MSKIVQPSYQGLQVFMLSTFDDGDYNDNNEIYVVKGMQLSCSVRTFFSENRLISFCIMSNWLHTSGACAAHEFHLCALCW